MDEARVVQESRIRQVLASLDLNSLENPGGSLLHECKDLQAADIAKAIKLRDTMSLLHGMGRATEVDLGKAEANLHDVASSPARQVIVPEWKQASLSPVREQLEKLTLEVGQLRQEVLEIKQDMQPIEQRLVHVEFLSSRAEIARTNPISKIVKVPRKDGSLPTEPFPK